VRFGVLFGEDLVVRGHVSSAEVKPDGSFALGLPEAPPDDHLTSLSKVYGDDLRGALYWVVAYIDADGDGHLDVDEVLDVHGDLLPEEDIDGDGVLSEAVDQVAGADMDRWLIYLDQADNEEAADWPLGWSLVDLQLSGQYEPNRCLYDSTEPLLWMTGLGLTPEFYELSSDLEVPLAGLSASLTLGGEVGILADGVVALPYQRLYQDEDLDKVFDTPVQANAYIGTVTEPPPDSHYVNSDPDWSYTYAIPVPYSEVTADGEYTPVDDLENATLCTGEEQVYLRYTRPVTTYRGYRFLECYGATAGWRLAHTDPETDAPVFWTSEDGLTADLDPQTCPLW